MKYITKKAETLMEDRLFTYMGDLAEVQTRTNDACSILTSTE